MQRRAFLAAGGRTLAGFALLPALGGEWRLLRPRAVVHVIHMRSDPRGERVFFDPVGLRVDPGAVVQWVLDGNVHTTTAYHPANGKPRRIPAGAAPWDSGYLMTPGETFTMPFEVPGVYDFFCRPHEAAGMVGRIVVGRPPFGADALPDGSGQIPEVATLRLPPIDRIVAQGSVAGG